MITYADNFTTSVTFWQIDEETWPLIVEGICRAAIEADGPASPQPSADPEKR